MYNDIEKLKQKLLDRKITKGLWCLHLPKTGGTFCKNVLNQLGHNVPLNRNNWQHEHTFFSKSIEPIAQKSGFQPPPCITENELKNYLSFAVLRNPFDLLVSHYEYGAERPPTKLGLPAGWSFVNEKHNIKSFEDFINKFTDKNFSWFSPPLQRFLFFPLYDDSGQCCVDAIIFNENLEAGLNALLSLFRQKIPENIKIYKRINKNRDRNYISYYTDKTRRLVENHCNLELKLFNYSFDGGNKNSTVLVPDKNINVIPKIITG